MKVGIKQADRIMLTGEKLNVRFLDSAGKSYTYQMTVDRYLGEGTSCICYEVTVCKSPDDPGQKRVLKQFYPLPMEYDLDIEMDGLRMDIAGYTDDPGTTHHKEITRLGAAFEEAFRRQSALSNSDEMYDIIVRPELCCFDGATKYVLYESDYGTTFDYQQIESFDDFLRIMCCLARALEKIHRHGLIYMDLKPANILISASGKVKLIDLDSVIDVNNLQNVHLESGDVRYDMSDPCLIAPEIRPDRLGEFEQNKRFFVNNRLDIYSFGAIMLFWFLHRYPTERDCADGAFRPEIEEIFTRGHLRKKLTRNEQSRLIEIIKKCISGDLTEFGRYENTQDLVHDLEMLQKLNDAPIEMRRVSYDHVSGRVQAAYLMDRFPICDYCRFKGENDWVMDSLIMGDHPMADDFFMNILSCAQMLDTKLVIRLACTDAEEKLLWYIKKWPLFKKSCSLFLEDEPAIDSKTGQPFHLNEKVTSVPFAEVRFYEWDGQEDPGELIDKMEDRGDISWILTIGSDIDLNLPKAEKTAQYMHSRQQRCFIGYLDERGDGYDMMKPSVSYDEIVLVPFSNNSARVLEEKNFQKGINRKALLLHKYYMREWNERARKEEIWKDFRSEPYNVNSSLCSILSIPYKLASLGIQSGFEKAAREYWNMVLNPENPDSARNKGRQICLEHRRWMSFMMTEGYDNSGPRFRDYAFAGDNDQRNKAEKLHICIYDCGEQGIVLDSFPHEMWDDPDFEKAAAEKGITLDPLDIMSVTFHQFCSSRIAAMVEQGVFESAFRKLERALRDEKILKGQVADAFNVLKIIHARMLDKESDINNIWEKTCRHFEETIQSVRKKFKTGTDLVMDAFRELKNLSRIIVERNIYHDYKSSDRTILEVIPLLIMSENPVRRIHKPVAEEDWQNVASSILIEPEMLFLYAEDPGKIDVDRIRSFLDKERGIVFSKGNIQVKSMQELYEMKVPDHSVRSVLDVTGLSGEEVYRLSNLEQLKSIPFILFRDGTLRSAGEEESVIDYYSVLRRHLTVRENFRLHHACIHSEANQNHMLGLADNYDKIWSSFIRMNSFKYKVMVDTLFEIEKGNYWKIKNVSPGSEKEFTRKHIPARLLQDTGIDTVLEALQKDNCIEKGYSIPESREIGTISVNSRYQDVIDAVDKMISTALSSPYLHHFEYIRTRREPLTGRPSGSDHFYIYDNTRVVDADVPDDDTFDAENNRKNSSIVKDALKIMLQYKDRDGEEMIISCEDNDPVKTSPSDNTYHIHFIYKNRATKECLLKEGNILEAYVYHSLWNRALVDDIKMNVAFTWEADEAEESLDPEAITNEIDLVCTYKMQTFFISCKQALPQTPHLQEIRFFADYFGTDGKAVLITSNSMTGVNSAERKDELISLRADKMGVYYIDRDMIGRKTQDMKQNRLAMYLQKVFNGDRDWNRL